MWDAGRSFPTARGHPGILPTPAAAALLGLLTWWLWGKRRSAAAKQQQQQQDQQQQPEQQGMRQEVRSKDDLEKGGTGTSSAEAAAPPPGGWRSGNVTQWIPPPVPASPFQQLKAEQGSSGRCVLGGAQAGACGGGAAFGQLSHACMNHRELNL